MQRLSRAVMLAAAVALTAGVGAATAGPDSAAGGSRRDCFQSTQWRGWSAPTEDILYLRVGNRDIYRVDLSVGSSQLKWGDNHLVSNIRGSTLVCSPIDLDLSVADTHGFKSPLIARSIRKLTPQEVAAIPKKDLP